MSSAEQPRLLFATRNAGKLRELAALVDHPELVLLSLRDLDPQLDIEETGHTFADNARLKADVAWRATGIPTIADDSGLEVDALDGRPGVHSARYAGAGGAPGSRPDATDAERMMWLLEEIEHVPDDRRSARFRCALAFVSGDQTVAVREGVCEGRLIRAPRGGGGFGYDPIFVVDALGCTLAEASAEQKNSVSHRAMAMRAMAGLLRDWLAAGAQ